MANWYEALQGQIAPQQINPAITQAQAGQGNLDALLGSVADVGNMIVPGGTNFGQTLGSSQFPDAQVGIAPVITPLGRAATALQGAGRSGGTGLVPASGGGNLPPALPPASGGMVSGGGMGGGRLPPPSGGGTPQLPPPSASAQGAAPMAQVKQALPDAIKTTLAKAQDLKNAVAATGLVGAGMYSLWRNGQMEEASAGNTQALTELDDMDTRIQQAVSTAMRNYLNQNSDEQQSFSKAILKVIYDEEAMRELPPIDMSKVHQRDMSEFMEHLYSTMPAKEREDPSLWQRLMIAAPTVIAGAAAAGPLGAIMGGAFGFLQGEAVSEGKEQKRQQAMDQWTDRLGGAVTQRESWKQEDSIRDQLMPRQAAQDDWTFLRGQQLGQQQDDQFQRGITDTHINRLVTAQEAALKDNRLRMQNHALSSMGIGDGSGMPQAQAAPQQGAQSLLQNPKAAQDALVALVSEYGTDLGGMVSEAQLQNIQAFLMAPGSLQNASMANLVITEILNGARNDPMKAKLAQRLMEIQSQQQQQEQMNQLRSMGGF